MRNPPALSPARPAYPTTFSGDLHIDGVGEGMAPEAFDFAGIDAPRAITRRHPVLGVHRLPMLGIDATEGRTLRDEAMAGGHGPHEGRP